MEQFNPSLRNFIAMGKNYEKALAGEAAGWEQLGGLDAVRGGRMGAAPWRPVSPGVCTQCAVLGAGLSVAHGT